jgi:hypothetical protein
MTTVANLLARKQLLLDRLQENVGPQECEEIERQLEQINTALNFLDDAGPGQSSDERPPAPRWKRAKTHQDSSEAEITALPSLCAAV